MRSFLSLFVLLAFAAPATAQGQTLTPSVNLGAALVRPDSPSYPGIVSRISLGTDIPLGSRFSLRAETGQRLPRHSHLREEISVFILDRDAGFTRRVPVPRVTEVDETALGDASLMLRFNSPPGESLFEVAALAGVTATWVDFERTMTTPRSLEAPYALDVIHEERVEMRTSYDVGMEVGRFVGDRWTVIAQGVVGFEKPFENDIRVHPRFGLVFKRRF